MNESLAISLYRIGAIQFGEFKLKSGVMSPVYINLRPIISYPDLLREVAKRMWEKVANTPFEVICGVPYTALPIATVISLEHHIPMIMRRKEKKDYGTKQMIEGVFQSRDRCLVVEDVITSGGSVLETADALKEAGLVVKDVVVLVDRNQGGYETLSQHFTVHTVLRIDEIYRILIDAAILSDTERKIAVRYCGNSTNPST